MTSLHPRILRGYLALWSPEQVLEDLSKFTK